MKGGWDKVRPSSGLRFVDERVNDGVFNAMFEEVRPHAPRKAFHQFGFRRFQPSIV
jgi:hypothetical protein